MLEVFFIIGVNEKFFAVKKKIPLVQHVVLCYHVKMKKSYVIGLFLISIRSPNEQERAEVEERLLQERAEFKREARLLLAIAMLKRSEAAKRVELMLKEDQESLALSYHREGIVSQQKWIESVK